MQLATGLAAVVVLVAAYLRPWTMSQDDSTFSRLKWIVQWGILLVLTGGWILWLTWFRKAIGVHKTKTKYVREPQSDQELMPDGSLPLVEPDPDSMLGVDSVEDFWLARQVSTENIAGAPPVTQVPRSFLYLASTKFISCFTEAQFLDIYGSIEWVTLQADDVLFEEGAASDDGLYIVVEGVLAMCRQVDGELTQLSEFQRGDSIGELELLTEEHRFYTCRATSECQLIRVTRALFNSVAAKRPDVFVSFVKTTISRHWRTAHAILDKFLRCPPPPPDQYRDHAPSLVHYFQTEDPVFGKLTKGELKTLEPGEVLFPECGDVEDLYVVVKGRMCEEGATGIIQYGVGTVVCAIQYVTGVATSRCVRAVTQVNLARMPDAELGDQPTPTSLEIVRQIVQALKPALHQFLEFGFQRQWVAAGTHLFRKGDPATHLYVVVTGRLRAIAKQADGTVHTRFEIGNGESVGEVSFFGGLNQHQHSVVCVRDTEVVKISRTAYESISLSFPSTLRVFTEVMAKRFPIASANHDEASQPKTIALVAASTDVDLSSFAQLLVQQLENYGTVFHAHPALVDKKFGEVRALSSGNYMHRSRMAMWLTEQEGAYTFLVLETKTDYELYTTLCVRSADVVLLVANGKGDPAVSKYETTLLWDRTSKVHARKELVLVHSDDTILPSGTIRWLKPRRCRRHHHFRKTRVADYAKLARHLTNTATGVVLSGGGARGLAHLGAMKALFEQNLFVDYVCGTSQGAFMAAAYAMSTSWKDLEDKTERIAKRMGNVWELIADATIPVMAYFSGESMNEGLKEILGENTQIEDLWCPFFCVSTDMTRADICVHTRGTLWRAVRASMTILDYLPPMLDERNGHLLIDGGYINNIPVDVMRDVFKPRFAVAVDVENKDGQLFQDVTNYGDHLSGWWLLKNKLWNWFTSWRSDPNAPRFHVPRFSELVSSLTYINHNRNVRQLVNAKAIDLYLRPELGDTKLLDYHKLTSIVDIGYRSCKHKVTEWRLNVSHILHPRHLQGRLGRSASFSVPAARTFDIGGYMEEKKSENAMGSSNNSSSSTALPVAPQLPRMGEGRTTKAASVFSSSGSLLLPMVPTRSTTDGSGSGVLVSGAATDRSLRRTPSATPKAVQPLPTATDVDEQHMLLDEPPAVESGAIANTDKKA